MKSRLAIASFIMSLASWVLLFIIPKILGSLFRFPGNTSGSMNQLKFYLTIILPVAVFASFILSIISIILSITSLRKLSKWGMEGKGYAIAGLIISSLFILVIVFGIFVLMNMPEL